MKKFLTIIFTLLTISVFSQTTLDHTFDGDLTYYVIGNSDYHVRRASTSDRTVSIYNASDYSLKTAITLPATIDNFTFNSAGMVYTEKYFDQDNGIEFLATYRDEQSNQSRLYVIDDNGTATGTYFPGSSAYIQQTINNGPKLIVWDFTEPRKYYVYKFTSLTTPISSPKISPLNKPFPNPSNDIITLSYELPEGTTGNLIITDVSGIAIKNYSIGSAFKQIIVNTSDLTPGVYNYHVISSAGNSQGLSFVVN